MANHHVSDVPPAQLAAHIQSNMDRLRQKSPVYGLLLSTMQLSSASRGVVTTRLTLEPTHLNSKGGLHGAVSAAIIDFTTGLAISSWDLRDATGASVDMHISYLSSARLGELVEVEARAEKVGGSLAFATIRIAKVAEDGELTPVTIGQHTKYVRQPGAKTT